MLQLFSIVSIMANAGLGTLANNIIFNWIGPIFLVGVAAFAIVFIRDRAWMKLATFVGIAAIVGILIFAGSYFFGANGTLTGAARDTAKDISANGGGTEKLQNNTIVLDGVVIPLDENA